MRPNTLSLTGDGLTTTNTDPLRMNWRGGTISMALDTDGSTTGFTAQYTLTSPDGYASSTAWGTAALWFNTSIAAASADAAGSIAVPVQGVRLQANSTGTDTATLTVIQADNK